MSNRIRRAVSWARQNVYFSREWQGIGVDRIIQNHSSAMPFYSRTTYVCLGFVWVYMWECSA